MAGLGTRYIDSYQLRISLPSGFHLPEEKFSNKEVQFREFFPLVKNSCSPTKNINKIHVLDKLKVFT